MRFSRYLTPPILVLCWLLASPPSTLAADLQAELNAIYRGTRSVLLLATASSCDASYTNNRIVGERSLSTGAHRLPPGELGRIAKVDVKRSRIDLLIDLDEPLRISWIDGPYELFDLVRCRVELEIDVPRDWVKKRRVDEIERLFSSLLEHYYDEASATRSERWNRREVEPLPAGYEEVLLDYGAWKTGQLRGELASILRDASRAIDRIDDDPAYGAGLVAGLEHEADRHRSWGACETLADQRFSPSGKDAPSEFEGSDERHWERGYRDGQVLAFQVSLAHRISECLRAF